MSVPFTIDILDVNEPPTIPAAYRCFNVTETPTVGTVIGKLSGSDPENDALTFTVTVMDDDHTDDFQDAITVSGGDTLVTLPTI